MIYCDREDGIAKRELLGDLRTCLGRNIKLENSHFYKQPASHSPVKWQQRGREAKEAKEGRKRGENRMKNGEEKKRENGVEASFSGLDLF